MRFAKVVVDISARALSDPYDYAIPEALARFAVVGAPVLAPFGRLRSVGYVVETMSESAIAEPRELLAVLGEPLFDEAAAALARWIAAEYVAPLADAFRLLLPPGGTPRAERVFAAKGERPRGALQARVWEVLSSEGPTGAGALRRRLGEGAPRAASALVTAGLAEASWVLLPSAAAPVDDRWASIGDPSAGEKLRASATLQRAILDALAEGPLRVSELKAELGQVDSALRRLGEMGAVRVERRRRVRGDGLPPRPAPRHEQLTTGQAEGMTAIRTALEDGGTVVLDGVTGSGKTEVYLQAIELVVSAGGGAIVLVPEISLTPQTVGRFRSRLGDVVAVLHSRLSVGERFDQWDRVHSGEARVVIGARSALFAPVKNLGLVVIDEEHEGSYKQGSSPRYHAREAARRLCSFRSAALVLGSATPSLETLASCAAGLCQRVVLEDRVGGALLPDVELVDMGKEFAEGHRSMFSRALLERLRETQDAGRKAVLLLNRRGWASFLLCRECGFVPKCDQCAISLTVHGRAADKLLCHHCASTSAVPPVCPRCSSPYLRRFGAGTQRVEAELAELFPELPIVRMDADTTAGKGGHERRLAAFEAMGTGVLLGTQMVAKGLDYPEVTLVGVLNADTSLHLPDFRAAERTYQLLEQAAGRAGRGGERGTVVLQTYWPEHHAIRAVAAHEREIFLGHELEERQHHGYPPFGRLANIIVSGPEELAAKRVSGTLAAHLAQAAPEGIAVLGPAPAPIAVLRGTHRWHVLLKGPAGSELPTLAESALLAQGREEGVRVAIDIDPAETL